MNLFTILVAMAVVAVVFTYVGIMLGRRSDKANRTADRIDAEIEHLRAEAKLKAAQARTTLKEHGLGS